MFAGAAREAVFSRADVLERVPREFVPVALKAALVNRPPEGLEGEFLREIGRSKPAPQGICVANPAGKVLAWALSFDERESVSQFLDHARKRFHEFPDASRPVAAERYRSYPSHKLRDTADRAPALPQIARHGPQAYCPATPPKSRGTVLARVWGRAVGADGRLAEDCRRQEHYVEDRFDIPPEVQAELARAAAEPGRFRLPDRLARLLASHAYLGQLDVRPIASPVPGHREDPPELVLWAEPLAGSDATGQRRYRVGGRTAARASDPRRQDGASFLHEVRLEWQGELLLDREHLIEIALYAEGDERLRWGNPRLARPGRDPVSHLPAGRRLDLETRVRYGVLGRPVEGKEAWQGEGPAPQPFVGGPPTSLRAKIERLGRAMRRHVGAGGDPRPFQPRIRRFTQLANSGRFAEAEAEVEELLDRLARASTR